MKRNYYLLEILAVCIFLFCWQIVLWIEDSKIGSFSDPLATMYFYSGWISIICLVLSLVIFKAFKKGFGYLAFVAAIIHSGIFVVIDFDWQLTLMVEELKTKYYLYFGMASFILLTVCFCLGRYFYKLRLNYVVYIAIILSLIHILMIQKVITFSYMLIAFGVVCI
ncbi:MAG: hypothetical protein K2I63_01115, partial [Helicobacter sp.]|nr:hypothetical protein [Helicobacter sp.]